MTFETHEEYEAAVQRAAALSDAQLVCVICREVLATVAELEELLRSSLDGDKSQSSEEE